MADDEKSNNQILQALVALSHAHTLYQARAAACRTTSLTLPRSADSDNDAAGADAVPAKAPRPLSRRLSLMLPFRSRSKQDKHGKDDGEDNDDTDDGDAALLKRQSFAGMQRVGCLFSVEVVAAQGLPPSLNGLLLTVAVRPKETRNSALQTMPTRVRKGAADFDETLYVRCHLYCSGGGGTGKPLKFEPRPFLLSVVAIDTPELDLGQRSMDFSAFVKEFTDKWQQGLCPRQWDATFPLTGKAKGGDLIVKLAFQIMEGLGLVVNSQPDAAEKTTDASWSSSFARKISKSSFIIMSPKMLRSKLSFTPKMGASMPDLKDINNFKLNEPAPVAEVKAAAAVEQKDTEPKEVKVEQLKKMAEPELAVVMEDEEEKPEHELEPEEAKEENKQKESKHKPEEVKVEQLKEMAEPEQAVVKEDEEEEKPEHELEPEEDEQKELEHKLEEVKVEQLKEMAEPEPAVVEKDEEEEKPEHEMEPEEAKEEDKQKESEHKLEVVKVEQSKEMAEPEPTVVKEDEEKSEHELELEEAKEEDKQKESEHKTEVKDKKSNDSEMPEFDTVDKSIEGQEEAEAKKALEVTMLGSVSHTASVSDPEPEFHVVDKGIKGQDEAEAEKALEPMMLSIVSDADAELVEQLEANGEEVTRESQQPPEANKEEVTGESMQSLEANGEEVTGEQPPEANREQVTKDSLQPSKANGKEVAGESLQPPEANEEEVIGESLQPLKTNREEVTGESLQSQDANGEEVTGESLQPSEQREVKSAAAKSPPRQIRWHTLAIIITPVAVIVGKALARRKQWLNLGLELRCHVVSQPNQSPHHHYVQHILQCDMQCSVPSH